MKKLLIWLLIGIIVTGISILFKSNITILLSMALLLMIPFTVITFKAVKSKNEAAGELEKKPELASSIYAVNGDLDDAAFEYRRKRQESMRSEASQLQAELGRIKNETESWRRVEKMAFWKLKCEVHFSLYEDLYAGMDEFASGIQLTPKLVEALTEPCLD